MREALLTPMAGPALPDAVRSFFRVREEKELRTAWSRASIRRWRQQSVPHSGHWVESLQALDSIPRFSPGAISARRQVIHQAIGSKGFAWKDKRDPTM